MNRQIVRVGITHGDVNGIGYEIIIKSLLDKQINSLCTPIVYGSARVAAYHRNVLNIDSFSFNNIKSASEASDKRPNIISCTEENVKVELGQATKEAGDVAFLALEKAVSDLKEGLIDVLVTAPINKDVIQNENFKFPGHTEYLADRFGVEDSVMLMVSEQLRVAVVTGHIPLKDVAENISADLIMKKLRILNESLVLNFGIQKPRIAVLGLNPHAGDNGLLGKEEQEVIQKALEQAKQEGILAMGPYPADGFFGSGDYRKFDVVLAMYHDQGLTPFKILASDGGVNFTAGLPVLRTSPAHGTAYSLAGKGKASMESFKSSIYTAIDLYHNRLAFEEAEKSKLKSK